MKKILVSDYDQTFYLNDEDIELNKIAVEKFRSEGNFFIIATGRSYADFKEKSEKYDIKYDYLIINHGATILDGNDNIMYNFSMNNDVISDIKQDLKLENSINHFCCSKLKSRVGFDYPDLTKINVKYDNREKSFKVNDLINKKYFEYVNSYCLMSASIEIISKETNKSKAIRLINQLLNVKKENIYTIGDGYTDIKMTSDFNGYCMENSVDELEKVAKGKYSSVSELIKNIMKNS